MERETLRRLCLNGSMLFELKKISILWSTNIKDAYLRRHQLHFFRIISVSLVRYVEMLNLQFETLLT